MVALTRVIKVAMETSFTSKVYLENWISRDESKMSNLNKFNMSFARNIGNGD